MGLEFCSGSSLELFIFLFHWVFLFLLNFGADFWFNLFVMAYSHNKVSYEIVLILPNFQENLQSIVPSTTPFLSDTDACFSTPNGYGLIKQERDVGPVTGAGRVEQLVPSPRGYNTVPLYQRLIAALITEEDCGSGDEDLKIDTYGTGFELDEEFDSNGSVHQFNFHSAGITAFNGCRITGKGDIDDEAEGDLLGISNSGITSNFNESLMISGMAFSEFQYDNMRVNEKLLLETGSIGIFPDPMVGLF